LKDTIQLARVQHNNCPLGREHDDQRAAALYDSRGSSSQQTISPTWTVGVLGMAFKGESDDIRSRVELQAERSVLKFKAGRVCSARTPRAPRPRALPLRLRAGESDMTDHRRARTSGTEEARVQVRSRMWNLLGRVWAECCEVAPLGRPSRF